MRLRLAGNVRLPRQHGHELARNLAIHRVLHLAHRWGPRRVRMGGLYYLGEMLRGKTEVSTFFSRAQCSCSRSESWARRPSWRRWATSEEASSRQEEARRSRRKLSRSTSSRLSPTAHIGLQRHASVIEAAFIVVALLSILLGYSTTSAQVLGKRMTMRRLHRENQGLISPFCLFTKDIDT